MGRQCGTCIHIKLEVNLGDSELYVTSEYTEQANWINELNIVSVRR